jgi:hypothetical protein
VPTTEGKIQLLMERKMQESLLAIEGWFVDDVQFFFMILLAFIT